ncbi:hypothetical protein HD596_004102 [Nonomuraea jabiensis]|uniref:Uncharacterized protein n=1 Tax=Nonomuraea jabiensis TaxID=882448 RepID=A0A7W9G524_9ACTN|nr:hypothetical protein [Nonomuraea jabiensis]
MSVPPNAIAPSAPFPMGNAWVSQSGRSYQRVRSVTADNINNIIFSGAAGGGGRHCFGSR